MIKTKMFVHVYDSNEFDWNCKLIESSNTLSNTIIKAILGTKFDLSKESSKIKELGQYELTIHIFRKDNNIIDLDKIYMDNKYLYGFYTVIFKAFKIKEVNNNENKF